MLPLLRLPRRSRTVPACPRQGTVLLWVRRTARTELSSVLRFVWIQRLVLMGQRCRGAARCHGNDGVRRRPLNDRAALLRVPSSCR